jgi:hypothetical protein
LLWTISAVVNFGWITVTGFFVASGSYFSAVDASPICEIATKWEPVGVTGAVGFVMTKLNDIVPELGTDIWLTPAGADTVKDELALFHVPAPALPDADHVTAAALSVTFCKPVSVMTALHRVYRSTSSCSVTEIVFAAHGNALDCWILLVTRTAAFTYIGRSLLMSWRIADTWMGMPVAEMLTGLVGSCGRAGL